jgi:hypothetical protein
MKEKTSPARPALALTVLGMLLLSGLPAPAGAEPRPVLRFSDGSAESTFYFGAVAETNGTGFTMPRKAVVRSAEVTVEGVAGLGGECPARPGLDLGAGGTGIWSFGTDRPGTGEMGRQSVFAGGEDRLTLHFPAGGGVSDDAVILLPSNATISGASMELSGGENFLPVRTLAPAGSQSLVAWNPLDGTLLQAFSGAYSYVVSERDPTTGAELGRHELPFRANESSYIKELRFMPSLDTAALLLPGRGVALMNLSSGSVRELFAGPEAASLVAMKSGPGWLAAAGAGWAAVEDLASGAEHRFDAAEFPSSVLARPSAVDYDSAGGRLFVAGWGSQYPPSLSVFHLDGRALENREVNYLLEPVDDILFLPGRETVLIGMGSVPSGATGSPFPSVYAVSLADGASSPVPAFNGLRGAPSLRLDGDVASALDPGDQRLVLLDIREMTWRTVPGGFQARSDALSWDYDAARQRLAVGTSTGEVWEMEPDFLNSTARAWPLKPEEPSIPSSENAAAAGRDIILGTDSGLMAIGPGGELDWSVGCGRVQAMALNPATGELTAAAMEDLRLDAGTQQWRYTRLNVSILDLSRSPPAVAGRAVEIGAGWADSAVAAVAPVPWNGTIFFALQGGSSPGLYGLGISNGSVLGVETPSQNITSLASSPDGRTVYAGFADSGLLALDNENSKRQLLTPFSEAALLSPIVSALSVDSSGELVVGQSPVPGAFPGGVSVFVPGANGTLNETFSLGLGDGGAAAVARDPAAGRIFIGGPDGIAVIDEATGERIDIQPGFDVGSLSWAPGTRTLAGAAGGAAFAITWTGAYPGNISLDFGADGSVEWAGPGRLDRPIAMDMGTALAAALAGHRPGARFAQVPLRMTAGTGGLVTLSSLVITYTLAERVDFTGALSGYLASLPISEEVTVPLELTAQGGGLRLSSLNVTYETAGPPGHRGIPEIKVDAAALKPTMVDLARYFSDAQTPSANLTYQLGVQGNPPGVSISLLFGHYLCVDARNSTFRGDVRVTVTARNAAGLAASTDAIVRVGRGGEYVPPPPAYKTLIWVFGAVIIVIGLLALRLYLRAFRRKE